MNNDYELLYLAKEDEQVEEIISRKYKNLIDKKVRRYSDKNTEEEYRNEALLTLHKAVQNYKENVPFIIYLNKCLTNSLRTKSKEINTKKNIISLSIEYPRVYNKLVSSDTNPEIVLLREYNYRTLKEKIIKKLTWEEELVLNLTEENYTPKEIAQIIDNNQKNVYNIIRRIRRKVSNIVSNERKKT